MSGQTIVRPGRPLPSASRLPQPAPDGKAWPGGMAPAKIVGRERDLEQGANLLARSRLLTLSGAGGIGKSLLARAAVARIPTNEGGAGASPTGTVDAPARRRVYVVDLDSTAG